VSDLKDAGQAPSHASGGSISTSLLARVKAKEEGAGDRLLFLYEPVVVAWCRGAGVPAGDAEDVSQEVFQAVFSGIDRFRREREEDTFRGWLYGVTRNKVRDYWRRCADRPQAAGGSDAQDALAQAPDNVTSGLSWHCESPEIGGLFRRALEIVQSEFEQHTYQAFWRVTIEEETPAEAAAALGMSAGAVYVAKSRVLKRLREELGDLESVVED
jgi:RNA polymerase sigma-70 factor (ECF subfamily)